MARFARLNIGASKTFDAKAFGSETRKAIEDGRGDAWKAHEALIKRVEAGEITSGDVLGTRASLKNNYLYRMHGTVAGIWGNVKEEAIYPGWHIDSTGKRLDGRGNHYQLRFAPGQLPPVNAFWSLTMYELPSHLLVANPINRYLINSPMLPNLKGALTLYVQADAPPEAQRANWLPAPKSADFSLFMRAYWPKAAVLDGSWTPPAVQRVN